MGRWWCMWPQFEDNRSSMAWFIPWHEWPEMVRESEKERERKNQISGLFLICSTAGLSPEKFDSWRKFYSSLVTHPSLLPLHHISLTHPPSTLSSLTPLQHSTLTHLQHTSLSPPCQRALVTPLFLGAYFCWSLIRICIAFKGPDSDLTVRLMDSHHGFQLFKWNSPYFWHVLIRSLGGTHTFHPPLPLL